MTRKEYGSKSKELQSKIEILRDELDELDDFYYSQPRVKKRRLKCIKDIGGILSEISLIDMRETPLDSLTNLK